MKPGQLVFAANHIGNPADMPVRSLEALRSGDLLVFEEDRRARQALKAAGIFRDYLRLSEHHQNDTIEDVRSALRDGKMVVYMSDQGMPNVADPGGALLKIAYEIGAVIRVIPGASSISAALAACPFLEGPYYYRGFLPRDEAARVAELRALSQLKVPTVILDTPYRLDALLSSCADVFGSTRKMLLSLDISGPSETFLLGSAREIAEKLRSSEERQKLNFVLIVDKPN